jgi:hypothetical protein
VHAALGAYSALPLDSETAAPTKATIARKLTTATTAGQPVVTPQYMVPAMSGVESIKVPIFLLVTQTSIGI